jgi:Lrp/AsnC family transcriptional regulator
MTGSVRLDAADIRILRIMQRDASLAVAEIAREAGMSQTPAWRRIKRLRDSGIISAIVAIIDSKAVGLGFIAYCFVKLAQPSRVNIDTFDRMVESWPEVLVCDRITGASDYLMKVVAVNIEAYDAFLRQKLLDSELVADVESRIVVSSVKSVLALPLVEA